MEYSTSIRDPILEEIQCSEKEKELINSPLVQRLRWVTQLSMVSAVYNGGTHTRFEHSLGAMVTAGEYMEHLLKTVNQEEWNKNHINMDIKKEKYLIQLARIAGLLHDIGHGPFSHSFDHVVYKKIYGIDDGGHDIARLDLIKSDSLRPYIEACGIDVGDLCSVWGDWTIKRDEEYEFWKKDICSFYFLITAIVEGPLGADRIDFIRRDSYHVGVQNQGIIRASRLMQKSKLVFIDNIPCLSYHSKCIEDIIRILDCRLNLYSSVYFHKTAMAASLLVETMLELICEPLGLREMTTTPEKFKRLTDHKILGMISEWVSSDLTSNFHDAAFKVKELYENLLDRKLPKMEFEERITDLNFKYDERDFIKKWYLNKDPKTYKIVRTRVISGISPKKFTDYNIVFHFGDKILSCSDCLNNIGYTSSIQPYYLVRGYSFNRP